MLRNKIATHKDVHVDLDTFVANVVMNRLRAGSQNAKGPRSARTPDTFPSAKAYVNHGRWVADCLYCTGAEMVDPDDPRFYCMSCFNEKAGNEFLRVAFPNNLPAIEAVLLRRPDPSKRNWYPHEGVLDLIRENQENGVE